MTTTSPGAARFRGLSYFGMGVANERAYEEKEKKKVDCVKLARGAELLHGKWYNYRHQEEEEVRQNEVVIQ